MHALIKTIVLLPLALLQITCKDTATGPTQKPFKDPREMTWTADTLSPSRDAIQLLPASMVAFSPNDVWLACWSDVAQKVMWHYDGTKWNESDIEGQSGPIGLDALAGNSSSDLWAGGFYGRSNSDYMALSYFNGSTWTRIDLNMPGEIFNMCTDISGNIWACGWNGVVLKYSDGNWTVDTIKVNHYSEATYSLRSITFFNNKIYALSANLDSKRKREVYRFINGGIRNWSVVDSMELDLNNREIKWGTLKFYAGSFGKLYSVGALGVWEYKTNTWTKILSSTATIYDIYGASSDYILAVGDFLQVYFNNGSGWQNIIDLLGQNDSSFIFTNAWSDGYEIIIVGFGMIDGVQKTIVWHGK